MTTGPFDAGFGCARATAIVTAKSEATVAIRDAMVLGLIMSALSWLGPILVEVEAHALVEHLLHVGRGRLELVDRGERVEQRGVVAFAPRALADLVLGDLPRRVDLDAGHRLQLRQFAVADRGR